MNGSLGEQEMLWEHKWQRKTAVSKEPKASTENETQEEQQKENLTNDQNTCNAKLTSETVDKQAPQPSTPETGPESFSAERMLEYQWPPDRTGEFYALRHQVCQFLEIESLEEKYPDLEKHIVAEDEKLYVKEKGVITDEIQELVAYKTEDICQLMIDDFPKKYQEYIRVAHIRERQRLIRKAEEEKKALETRKVANYIKRAIKDAAEFNAQLAQQRREERCSYFDMQTQIIHVPSNKTTRLPKQCTKPSLYPVSLLPGQFQEYFKRYSPEELNNFPLGTVMEMPKPPLPPAPYVPPEQEESEESDDISLPESTEDEVSGSSSEEEPEEPPAKKTPGKYKPPKRPDAVCGICLKGPDTNKKGLQEDLIHCSQCENSGHPSCLDMNTQLVAVIQTYPWQCMECKTCIICRDPFDEDKMLFCDECDRGYHSFCVGLKQIPVGRWTCDMCGMCASCLRRSPGEGNTSRWKHEYTKPRDGSEVQFLQTLCTACSRLFRAGNFCPVCLKVYRNDESDLPMVCCDMCDRWVHTDCDGIDEKAYAQLARTKSKYSCVLCRGEKQERMDSFHRKNRNKTT
ncbi:PHD finger protein 10-like isoform X4 [Orbicella faveolata]|uniref:PHD finger protein 10-like isoform X4 n=1 Tax=Orbicella faveolata TaxID=48498 RepID=UPI0009E5479B|nr:PHD finger protein 10-like isoform X4 [Orbicella faveolata]